MTTVDLLGVSLIIPLLTKHARDLGASASVAGIVGSVYGSLQLLSSPLVGRWSDVSGRRFVLLCCLLFASIGYLMLGLSTSVMIMAVSRVLPGIFKHTQELIRGYLADVIPVGDRSRVFGNLNAAANIGFIIGPVLGGHLADIHGGFNIAAFITASIFLLNLCVVWYFIPEGFRTPAKPQTSNNRTKSWFPFLQSFKEVSWDQMWDIFLVRFLMGFSVIIYRNNFALMLDYKYEATGRVTGYIISYSGIVGTLASFLVGRISKLYGDDSKLLLYSGIVQFLSLSMLVLSPSLIMLIIALTPLSIANQVARVCSVNLTIQRGQGQEKGMLLGLGGSVLSFARMLSPTVGGFAQEYHISGPGLVGTACSGLGVATMLFSPYFRRTVSKKKQL